jgi:ABC-type sugar transport system ATPase subunit
MAPLAGRLQGLSMLRLEKIGKQFESGTTALSEINLEIAPRAIVSVVGASGSGKSTLLRIISGLEAPTTGELFWQGLPIDGPRRDIGFIFQEPRLMPWLTVTANVRLGLGPIQQGKGRRRLSLLHQKASANSESLGHDLVSEVIRRVGLERFAHAKDVTTSHSRRDKDAAQRGQSAGDNIRRNAINLSRSACEIGGSLVPADRIEDPAPTGAFHQPPKDDRQKGDDLHRQRDQIPKSVPPDSEKRRIKAAGRD